MLVICIKNSFSSCWGKTRDKMEKEEKEEEAHWQKCWESEQSVYGGGGGWDKAGEREKWGKWSKRGPSEDAWSIVHLTESLRRVSSVNKWINLSASVRSMTPSLCSPQTSGAPNPLLRPPQSNLTHRSSANITNGSADGEYVHTITPAVELQLCKT